MKKIITAICVFLCLILAVLWQILSENYNYYLISVTILFLSMLPFFVSFEKSRPSAKEIALLSSMIALAVVSRAVFYLTPQVKPIAAVVVISGVCFGAKRGYLVGAFSAFISNFLFGQGVWTPFQMVALGCVGLFAGLIFKKIKPNKYFLALVGFFLAFAVYGLIVDFSSVLMLAGDFNLPSVISVYAAGIPFSGVFAVTTAVLLFLFGEPFVRKLNRITVKYGLISDHNEVTYE